MKSFSTRGLLLKPWSYLLFALLCLAGCKEQSQPTVGTVDEVVPAPPSAPAFDAPELPAPRSQAFVGSQKCQECHQQICDAFHTHPMGRSSALTTDAPIEDYSTNTEFQLPPTPRLQARTSYAVEKNDSGVFHHEILRDGEGKEIYDLSVPVHYAIGSGQRGRSYLTQRDGIMLMSPITWYSQAQKWDLSPGYEHANLHFGRRIVDGCLSCHVGRVADVKDKPDQYQANPFPEISIGCENCHGPGESHVLFQEGSRPEVKDTIVNPAKLSADKRDHVCFQCHLIGEHRLLRYGRTQFDFRPGDDVSDIWAIFVKDTGIDDENQTTAAVSQVEQMLSSTCYTKSNGELGCISCHDSHERPTEENRVEFYRSSCLKCHSAGSTECSMALQTRLQKTAEDSCIVCHMPGVEANDVPHTSQTDHRIMRDPSMSKRPTQRPQLTVFQMDKNVIPEPELNRAIAVSLVRNAEQTGNSILASQAIDLLEDWLAVVPDDLEARIILGGAYALLDEHRLAIQTWETALESSPDNEYVLRRLFVLFHETEQFEQGVTYGERLVEINPWEFEYKGRLAHMLAQVGRVEDGAKVAEEALTLHPGEVRIHTWLADVYGSLGNSEKSEFHAQQAKRLSE